MRVKRVGIVTEYRYYIESVEEASSSPPPPQGHQSQFFFIQREQGDRHIDMGRSAWEGWGDVAPGILWVLGMSPPQES